MADALEAKFLGRWAATATTTTHYTDGSNDMAKAVNRRAHDEGMIFLPI
jgi:hypothetical protein